MAAPKEWARNGSFMKKPPTGWLHNDSDLTHGDGIYYAVKVRRSHTLFLSLPLSRKHTLPLARPRVQYVGKMALSMSMRTMRFEDRTAVTRWVHPHTHTHSHTHTHTHTLTHALHPMAAAITPLTPLSLVWPPHQRGHQAHLRKSRPGGACQARPTATGEAGPLGYRVAIYWLALPLPLPLPLSLSLSRSTHLSQPSLTHTHTHTSLLAHLSFHPLLGKPPPTPPAVSHAHTLSASLQMTPL
jgi:hypothetical protein